MSDLRKALDKVLVHEGFYNNISGDKGGETYCGISRKNHPKWNGWAVIDSHKPLKYNQKINDCSLEDSIVQFYNENYWQAIKGDKIKNQYLAELLFDYAVNSGVKTASKKIQTIIGVKADGIIGEITIGKLNSLCAKEVFMKLKKEREDFYKSLVKKDSSQEKFLKGWLNRLNCYDFEC